MYNVSKGLKASVEVRLGGDTPRVGRPVTISGAFLADKFPPGHPPERIIFVNHLSGSSQSMNQSLRKLPFLVDGSYFDSRDLGMITEYRWECVWFESDCQ